MEKITELIDQYEKTTNTKVNSVVIYADGSGHLRDIYQQKLFGFSTLKDFERKIVERSASKIEVKLNDEYTAEVVDGKVIVGCQEISFEKVFELASKIKGYGRIGTKTTYGKIQAGEYVIFTGLGRTVTNPTVFQRVDSNQIRVIKEGDNCPYTVGELITYQSQHAEVRIVENPDEQ